MSSNISWSEAELYKKLYKVSPNYGSGGGKFFGFLEPFITDDVVSILDFGCGRNHALVKKIQAFKNIVVHGYDPGINEEDCNEFIFNIDERLLPQYDIVLSTDCMEHIPEIELPQAEYMINGFTPKYLFFAISTRKAHQILSDKSNAHKTIQSGSWWEERFNHTYPNYNIQFLNRETAVKETESRFIMVSKKS